VLEERRGEASMPTDRIGVGFLLSSSRPHRGRESSSVCLPDQLVATLSGNREEVEVDHDTSLVIACRDPVRMCRRRAGNIGQVAGIAESPAGPHAVSSWVAGPVAYGVVEPLTHPLVVGRFPAPTSPDGPCADRLHAATWSIRRLAGYPRRAASAAN
jgi:hypothetical protein